MKKTISIVLITLGLLTPVVNAEIVSVSGLPSIPHGTVPTIIAPPTDVLNSFVANTGQQGFDESQGVVTTAAYSIDGGGSIPVGAFVSSHMIFLNAPTGTAGITTHTGVTWTFDGPIIGVMSDSPGNLEAASTGELGAPGTNYTVGVPSEVAPYPARGMEGGDSYLVAGHQITVSMSVTQPGDWIRVVTLAPPIEAVIDIKPGSCPSAFNPKSKGVVPVAIVGSADLDVTEVDVGTIQLITPSGVAISPVDWGYDDSTQPVEDPACDHCFDAGDPTNFNCDLDGDGLDDAYCGDEIQDLVLKFDAQELATAIGGVTIGDCLELFLMGNMLNGAPIEGSDFLVSKTR